MYPIFDSVEDAKAKFKLCRKNTKTFILSEKGIREKVCVFCGNKLKDAPKNHPDVSSGYKGNRCIYSPKHKKVACLHYLCSWEALLHDVFRISVELHKEGIY